MTLSLSYNRFIFLSTNCEVQTKPAGEIQMEEVANPKAKTWSQQLLDPGALRPAEKIHPSLNVNVQREQERAASFSLKGMHGW